MEWNAPIPQWLACLQAEIQKSRNSWAVWLSLAGTVANVLIFFGMHWLTDDWIAQGENPWWGFTMGFYEGIAFMMLPLYVIILCTLVTFLEHRQGMWVNLDTLPVPPGQVYWSKQLFTLGLFVVAHLLFIIGMLLAGVVLGLLRPETGLLEEAPDAGQIAGLALRTVWTILGLLGFQFWISWRFPQFIVPLLIGILGFVTVTLLGPAWPGSAWLPYAYPIQYAPAYRGAIDLVEWGNLPAYVWLSPVYFILFSVIGMGFRWRG